MGLILAMFTFIENGIRKRGMLTSFVVAEPLWLLGATRFQVFDSSNCPPEIVSNFIVSFGDTEVT